MTAAFLQSLTAGDWVAWDAVICGTGLVVLLVIITTLNVHEAQKPSSFDL